MLSRVFAGICIFMLFFFLMACSEINLTSSPEQLASALKFPTSPKRQLAAIEVLTDKMCLPPQNVMDNGVEVAHFWQKYAAYNEALTPLVQGQSNVFDRIFDSSYPTLKFKVVYMLGCMHPASRHLPIAAPLGSLKTSMDIRETRKRIYRAALESYDDKAKYPVFEDKEFELNGLENRLVELVDSDDPKVSKGARRALSGIEVYPTQSLDRLMIAAKFAKRENRKLAYEAIRQNGSAEARLFLFQEILTKGHDAYWAKVIGEAALSSIDAVPPKQLKKEVAKAFAANPQHWQGLRKSPPYGAKILKQSGNESQLAIDMASTDEFIFGRAMMYLGHMDPGYASPLFVKFISDENRRHFHRMIGVHLGSRVKDAYLQKYLVSLVNNDSLLGEYTIDKLRNADPVLAIPALKSYIERDPTYKRIYRAAPMIRVLGEPEEAFRLLMQVYPEVTNDVHRLNLFNQMSRTETSTLVPLCFEILSREQASKDLQRVALRYIAAHPDSTATSIITPFLDLPAPDIRRDALSALGAIGTRESIEAALTILPEMKKDNLVSFYRNANKHRIRFNRETRTIIPGTAPWNDSTVSQDR